jgi:hypothetical protein
VTRSGLLWPAVLIVSGAGVVLLAVGDVASPLRPLVALWFLLVCPGMAVVRRLGIREPVAQWTLAVAVSLALDTLVAGTMLYSGVWFPKGGLVVLLGLTAAAGAPDLAAAVKEIVRLGAALGLSGSRKRGRAPPPRRERAGPAGEVLVVPIDVGAPSGAPTRDVVVTGTFRKVGGAPGGGYGFVVRHQKPSAQDGADGHGRYYLLEASDLGMVGIWRRDHDGWADLLPWTPSEAVRHGEGGNELAVWAIGQRLTFFVNGVEVASLEDRALTGGGVGVSVGGDHTVIELKRLTVSASPEGPRPPRWGRRRR